MGKVVQSGAKAGVWRSLIQFDVSFDVVRYYSVRRVAVSTFLKMFVQIKL